MNIEKFYDIVGMSDRSRAITARHEHFEDIGRILSKNSRNISKAMEEIACYVGYGDTDFKDIFLDYFKNMLRQESEDFSAQIKQIEKEIQEA